MSGPRAGTRNAEADALLVARGAGDLAHPGGNLLHHLQRTSDLLRGWEAPEATVLAGRCHAAYGTAGFPAALLALDERDVLRSAIGDEAEAIVHRYGSCDRAATYPTLATAEPAFTDRFAGAVVELDADGWRSFALVSLANELDIVRHGDLAPEALHAIATFFERLAPFALDEAEAALAEVLWR
ncbi:hypothetical protein KSP35_14745 [Aquihabitans sp. G128]|uniref:DUF6817 domain-containing protein n=1 Tax=Aquihabitans sp. G128 TaxID=2849779 RepID=UPI001C22D042|nr:hypothetical protein [Aquihabitans sp. G128]QXC59639.1 hypothetical protein KSP35_14745 [Aquihabitans sp. G128]